MSCRVRRRTTFSEHEIKQRRQIDPGDKDSVGHAAEDSARRHRATAGLEVSEDHADAVIEHSLTKQILDVLDAERIDGDGNELVAASSDLLDGGDEARGKLAVACNDRARLRVVSGGCRIATHCLPQDIAGRRWAYASGASTAR